MSGMCACSIPTSLLPFAFRSISIHTSWLASWLLCRAVFVEWSGRAKFIKQLAYALIALKGGDVVLVSSCVAFERELHSDRRRFSLQAKKCPRARSRSSSSLLARNLVSCQVPRRPRESWHRLVQHRCLRLDRRALPPCPRGSPHRTSIFVLSVVGSRRLGSAGSIQPTHNSSI